MRGILEKVKSSTLPEVIAKQVKQALGGKELGRSKLPYNLVAIEGKNLYTTRGKISENNEIESATKRSNMALRGTLVSSAITQVLGQRLLPGKSAKTTELIPFLTHLKQLYGETDPLEVVSVDAGMTHRHNADFMAKK
jgi:hypothetical protein